MYNKGDFHLHTTASDGKLSPEELVRLAKKNNIDIIAITDHDTTMGVDRAIAEGLVQNVKVISGIELSTEHNGETVHILGFFKDDTYKSNEFQDLLYDIKNFRIVRAKKIIENLERHFDIKLDYQKVYENAKGVIARPHIAKAIIESGYNYSWDYIFDNIIGKDSPAYVPNKKVTVPEAIEILKSVNAITILAHPVLLKKVTPNELIKYDFDGMEAIYSLNTKEDTAKLTALAKEHDKLITAGSDYHGHDLGDTKHGYIGYVYAENSLIEKIINKLEDRLL